MDYPNINKYNTCRARCIYKCRNCHLNIHVFNGK